MTNKEKKQLLIIKKKSVEAYTQGMLPKCLVQKIININDDCSSELIKFYSYMTERELRVKGYYKKYPLENKRAEIDLNLLMKEKGLI